MNDNDIIKALECCVTDSIGSCDDCPCYTEELGCDCNLKLLALDLINRQKAEIETLQKRYDLAVAEREANVKGFAEQLSTIRAEVVKEFAEKLKSNASRVRIGDTYDCQIVTLNGIDHLVKELTEEHHDRS